MATTSPVENVLGLSNKDLSLIRKSLEAGGKLIHQVINGLKHGTNEVQQLILQQSDVILECRVCRNLFRSLPNYLDHKRIYCQESFPNERISLLASPFAAEVPIIYPEPPDDAREFVEMSDLMSNFNRKNRLQVSAVEPAPASPQKDKAHVPNIRQSIGRTLEQSCQRKKPQPLCLKPIKETKVAVQLVPLTTTNNGKEKTSYSNAHRNVGLSLVKMANFHELLCLKCNRTYSSKKRLIYHIKKFHKKKLWNGEEDGSSNKCKTNSEVKSQIRNAKAGRSKESKPKKGPQNDKNDHESFPTKSKKVTYIKKNGWCQICNHYYSGERGLTFHMYRMHSGRRKIYTCPLCKVKSPSFASALRHVQTLHKCKKSEKKQVLKMLKASGHVENQKLPSMFKPEVKVEKCDSKLNVLVQGNKVPSLSDPRGSAEDDTNSKTSQQECKLKCPKCFQLFCGTRGLRHHMTRKHPVPQKKKDHQYACHICSMAFFTNFTLNRHYRLKHNIQENVQENTLNPERKVQAAHNLGKSTDDKYCLFYNNRKYRIPIKYYKTVSKFAQFPSLCLNCQQTCVNARDLIWHIIKEHSANKNAFPCPFCHLSFISSVSILRHTKVQHSCSEQEIADLNRKLQVWEQQKKGHDLKIRKPVNNNSNSTNAAALVPFSIHDVTDFKTATCFLCNRKFLSFQGLTTHISRIHRTLLSQEHKCSRCSESFQSIVGILKHMENIHNVCFEQKPTPPETKSLSAIGRSAESPFPVEKEKQLLPSPVEKRKQLLPSTVEKEKQLDKIYGEDAQSSQLVMQCADFHKSQCIRCKELFTGNRGLIAHIHKAHARHGQTFSCYICLKTFSSFALASQHTRNSHIYKGNVLMYVRVDNIGREASTEKLKVKKD